MAQEIFQNYAENQMPKPRAKEQGIDFTGQMANLASRLRLLEERYSLLQRRAQLIDKNMLEHAKDLHVEVKTINSEISDMKNQLNEVTEKTSLIIRELSKLAPKDEVEVMKKYLGYWQPLNFVTQSEVEKIVKRIIDIEKPEEKAEKK